MHIKWLEDFIVLARTRSFTRAADERSVTLPAFGRRIKSLEAWVGVPLIDRGGYPTTLTAEGEIFLQSAQESLAKLYGGRALLRARSAAGQDTLCVATGRTLAHTQFSEILDRVRADLGTFNIRVSTGSVHDMSLLLEEGAADVLLSYYSPTIGLTLNPAQFEHMVVATETLLPVCRPDLFDKPRFNLPGSPRKPLPLLSFQPTLMMGKVLDMHLHTQGENYCLQRIFTADFAEALLEQVYQGQGIAWLPRRLIAEALGTHRLVHAGTQTDEIPLEIRLYRNTQHAKPLVNQLWQSLLTANTQIRSNAPETHPALHSPDPVIRAA